MCMISFDENDKVMFFIDRMNVEAAAKESGASGGIDYYRLCVNLARGRSINGAMLFDSEQVGDDEQRLLHSKLKREKFRIILPKGQRAYSSKQMGVDVSLALEVLECAYNSACDVIIVVSGDGDFIPLVEKVKSRGKKIEFASFSFTANNTLVEDVDRFVHLDDIPFIRASDGGVAP